MAVAKSALAPEATVIALSPSATWIRARPVATFGSDEKLGAVDIIVGQEGPQGVAERIVADGSDHRAWARQCAPPRQPG